jgi:hypothetical protein
MMPFLVLFLLCYNMEGTGMPSGEFPGLLFAGLQE